MKSDLERTVRHLRLGEDAAASEALVEVIDRVGAALSAGALPCGPEALLPVMQRLLEAQQRGDMIHVADLLEHEVAPLLD